MGEREGAGQGLGVLLAASILCAASSACAQPEVWRRHQSIQPGSGSPIGAEPTKWHAHHQPVVEPVSHRDCPLQPLRALQQAPGLAGPPADLLLAAAFNNEPHAARAFLSTFRQHNQAARLILLVFPAQVPPGGFLLMWPAARALPVSHNCYTLRCLVAPARNLVVRLEDSERARLRSGMS